MKKKIINGILMVALVAATSTSFVSCKDNSEDVRTDLMAQITKARTDLEPRVDQAEKDIKSLDGRIGTAENDLKYLKTRIAGIRDTLNNLEDFRDSVYEVTQRLDKRLDTVDYKINTLVETLKNLITSVTVNATSTGVLENSKLFPGINMQFLGAVYGEADKAGEFPSTDAGYYVAGHGVVLTEAEIAGAEGIEWGPKAILPLAEGDKSAAGTVYFTVNPSNIQNLDNVKLSLINSQDKEGYLTLGTAKQSGKILSWGTRAEEFGVKLFEAPAYINLDAEGLAVVDPTEMINFTAIAGDLKDMINAAKGVQKNASSVKSTGKEIIKGAASIVANVVKAKVPSLPAVALKAQWEDTVGVRSVISDYSIAATAVKPLSLRFGKGLGTLPTISLDRIDSFVAQIADSVKAKFPDFSKYIVNNITIGTNGMVYVSVSANGSGSVSGGAGGTVTINVNGGGNADLRDLQAQINTNFVAMVNNMLGDMTDLTNEIGKYTNRAANATDKATDYLENFINRVILKLNDDGLTRVLEPILLIQGDKGVSRFSAKTVLNAGEYKVLPTTVTNEFIAPLYKKYVAVLKDGKIVKAWNLTRGDADANGFTYDFAKGDYTVVYAGLDFFGNQIAKRYNVTVK